MSVFSTGHQRNNSAGVHLIGATDDCEAGAASPYASTVTTDPPTASTPMSPPAHPSMRYTAAAMSDDCSSYYGAPGIREEVEYSGCLCKDPHLRANIRVIIGSLLLTIVGIALFAFGFFVMVVPNEIDVHGWIFCLVGVLFFIPGFYHIVYITCTVLERPGYSFDNLPTFRRPL
uniref:Transmembrane protein 230 n=1 Tax=Panagrellus redivivus TaxID=6233 RepID=A0A7E4UZI1_PANRE